MIVRSFFSLVFLLLDFLQVDLFPEAPHTSGHTLTCQFVHIFSPTSVVLQQEPWPSWCSRACCQLRGAPCGTARVPALFAQVGKMLIRDREKTF